MRSSMLTARDSAGLNVTPRSASTIFDGLTAKERSSYSVVNVINSLAGEQAIRIGMETEISNAIAEQWQKPTRGMYVPTQIRAGLDTKTGGAGGFTVQTSVQDIVDLFRARSRVLQLGATLLPGLDSNISFPVEVTGTTGSWVSQNPGADVADVDATFSQKIMSPKTYQASTSFSRQLLRQTGGAIESFVRRDIAAAHAVALDAAAVNGSGASNQPLGLLNTVGIGDFPMGTNGLAPTHDAIVALEALVADANGPDEGLGFLTNPIMRSKLRRTAEFATWGEPIWGPGNTMLGYPAAVSKNVPQLLTKGSSTDCSAIIFGSWPQMLVGEWGVLEILVDEWRLKKQNLIEVTSVMFVDVLVRSVASFAAIKDARNV